MYSIFEIAVSNLLLIMCYLQYLVCTMAWLDKLHCSELEKGRTGFLSYSDLVCVTVSGLIKVLLTNMPVCVLSSYGFMIFYRQ